MDHPTAVIEKAQRLEKLLQRVVQGEPLEQVCAELDLAVDAERLAKLQAKYEAGGCTWEALIEGGMVIPRKPIPRCGSGFTSASGRMRS
jgi:hypothetical protein